MSWRDAAIEHPDVVLLATRTAEPFHRAKPIAGLLQLIAERNCQLAVRRRDRVREGQHVTTQFDGRWNRTSTGSPFIVMLRCTETVGS